MSNHLAVSGVVKTNLFVIILTCFAYGALFFLKENLAAVGSVAAAILAVISGIFMLSDKQEDVDLPKNIFHRAFMKTVNSTRSTGLLLLVFSSLFQSSVAILGVNG
jgi:hypothetical protein